jgi:hypothetical protein
VAFIITPGSIDDVDLTFCKPFSYLEMQFAQHDLPSEAVLFLQEHPSLVPQLLHFAIILLVLNYLL